MPDQVRDDAAGHEGVAQEGSDIQVRYIVMALSVFTVLALVMIGFVFGMGAFLDERDEASRPVLTPAQRIELTAPEPRLQPNPVDDLNQLRAREERTLSTFGWVTPDRARARIPLEQAEALMVGRSLDAPPP